MNNKAWIRILEAVIGITIILGVLVLLYSQNTNKQSNSEAIYNLERSILDQIAYRENLRDYILTNNETEIMNFIRTSNILPPELEFNIKICDLNDLNCNVVITTEKDIFVQERIISSTLDTYSPKKIRIFVWEN